MSKWGILTKKRIAWLPMVRPGAVLVNCGDPGRLSMVVSADKPGVGLVMLRSLKETRHGNSRKERRNTWLTIFMNWRLHQEAPETGAGLTVVEPSKGMEKLGRQLAAAREHEKQLDAESRRKGAA